MKIILSVMLSLASLTFVQEPLTPQRIILISIDGARPDAIQQVPTPNIDVLAERGAVTWMARTTFPPVTLPAHTSMLTGLGMLEHGVTWNDYSPEMIDPTLYPTFLTIAQQNGYKAAIVAGKEKMEQLQQIDEIPFIFATSGDPSVVDEMIPLLDEGYEVFWVHLPNVDYFGHSRGWMSDVYLNELTNTDRQIGRIVTALEERDLLDDTLIAITADHGGTGIGHGRDIPEDMLIPWIIAGPNIKAGFEITTPVFVGDTAPTILCALGLPIPESIYTQPVSNVFETEGCEG